MANFLDGLLSGKNAFTQTTASFAQPAVGANVTVPVVYSGWTAVGMAVFLEVGGNYQVVSIPNDSSIQIKNLGSSGNAAVSASVPPGRMAPAGAPGANGTSGTGAPAPDYVATSNIALTGNVVVDGVSVPNGKLVLCTAQTTPAENGYWTANTGGVWTRPSFYNTDAAVAALLGITTGAVISGTLGTGTVWFQSSGLTLAGSKTWTRLATPSLLQDALGTTLPAQTLTQHKGAAILRDPTNGRNSVDHDRVDIREYGGNPTGVQQTTYSCLQPGRPTDEVTLGSALTYAVGQWLMLHQAGAAHGLATPGTPILAVQGKPGTRTISVKWIALTSTHGYTTASVATTTTTAGQDTQTTLAVGFTQPAATIQLTFASTKALRAGAALYITGGGCYTINSVDSATLATVLNLGSTGNVAVGQPVAAGGPASIYQTMLSGTIVRPSLGNTVNLPVVDSSQAVVGNMLSIAGDVYQAYYITAVPDSTHVTVRYDGNGVTGARAGGAFVAFAGDVVTYYNYVEAWCPDVPGAYRYALYVQFDGAGQYSYYGQTIAHPSMDQGGYQHQTSLRITTSTAQVVPPGLPADLSAIAAVPNALRTQITALNGAVATVFPIPISSATGAVCEICNKLAIENAINAIAGSSEVRLAKGRYYCAGDLDIRNTPHIKGGNGGQLNAGAWLLFRDGFGTALSSTTTAFQWQPGTLYRLGDRVTSEITINNTGTWVVDSIAAGAAWGVSGTTVPTWNATLGATTSDGPITWRYNQAGLTAAGIKIDHIGFDTTGRTAPAGRATSQGDLRISSAVGERFCNAFLPGHVYAPGSWVLPEVGKSTGKMYRTTTGGTSGAGPASWGRVIGGATNDGTIADWTCYDMQWIQGAGITCSVPHEFSRCAIQGFRGTQLMLEGNPGSNGGNCDNSTHSDWALGGTDPGTGNGFVLRGTDANLVRIRRGDFYTSQVTPSIYDAPALWAVQDAGFYGVQLDDPLVQAGWSIQNKPPNSGSVQVQGRALNLYTEGTPSVDWNGPAKMLGGGIFGRLRDRSTAEIDGGPYNASGGSAVSSPKLTVDRLFTAQRDYDSGAQTWIDYNGNLIDGSVANGGFAQRNYGSYNPLTGRVLEWILTSSAKRVAEIDHFGPRGIGYAFPPGASFGIQDGAGSKTGIGAMFEIRAMGLAAIPTLGLFRRGDVLPWTANAARLAIVPSRDGGVGQIARANSTPYAQGIIITTSSKLFVAVLPTGVSSGSLPAGFASAVAGGVVTDGTQIWYCYGTDQSPLLRAVPNLSAEPVALAATTATIQVTAGPVRRLAAAAANISITLGNTGAMPGDGMRIENPNSVAFTVAILNGGTGGGTIATLPITTKSWIECIMNDAGAWEQARYGVLL